MATGDVDPWTYIYFGQGWTYINTKDDGAEGDNFLCDFYAEAGKAYYIELYGNVADTEYDYTVKKYDGIIHQPSTKEPYVELSWNKEASYQWYMVIDFNEVELDGETEATLKAPELGKTYFCRATLEDGTVFDSSELKYTYTIMHEPTADELYVSVNDSTDATYQWYTIGGERVEITGELAKPVGADGATESTYTPTEEGSYFCEVSFQNGAREASKLLNVEHVCTYEWASNDTEHWQECTCGKETTPADHTDENSDGKCDTCDFGMTTGTPDNPNGEQNGSSNGTNAPNGSSNGTNEKDGLGTGAIIGIVLGIAASFAVLGGGSIAICWFVIRKKKASK